MAEVTVGAYLLQRIKQLGIEQVFGVPGDFELALLDLVPEAGLEWRGNANELIASYAADGYARVAGVGAFITTFGPGELSAVNGVAGSFTEFVPVVHIVGYPNTSAQRAGAVLHHTLGNGDFSAYHEVHERVTCATTVLNNAKTAPAEVDRVLNAMMYYSQPVYIGVPTDICFETVTSLNLSIPLRASLPENNPTVQTAVIEKIMIELTSKKLPIIIVDGGAVRHRVIPEALKLAELTQYPVFTTSMSKGAMNEKSPRYGGVYAGAGTKDDVKAVVESSDCVLWIGNFPSDFNTGEFTDNVKEEVIIDFERFWVSVGVERFAVNMKGVLAALLDAIAKEPKLKQQSMGREMQCVPFRPAPKKEKGELTHAWMWPRLGPFHRPFDLIITETGTSNAGLGVAHLPPHVHVFSQTVFGSIGYATGAILGAAAAAAESRSEIKRCILYTGDGSLQLTVQSLADILRYGLKPIIFILNNAGYTIERMIHGYRAPYNDIPAWNYQALLSVFGSSFPSRSYKISTPDELEHLLDDEEFNKADVVQVVELILDPLDAPASLHASGKAVEAYNMGKWMEKYGEHAVP